jgi:hypothetical protein
MGYDGLSTATPTFSSTEMRRQVTADVSSATGEPSLGTADNYAAAWLRGFHAAIKAAGLPWYPPHVGGTDEEISLEWWRGNRNLTVFVRGFEVEVLSVSGPNMNTDVDTLYRVDQPEEAVRVWRWLRGE